MAGSFPIFDTAVEKLAGWMAPSSALDVGTGSGKYGRLLRRVVPTCECVGIEVESAVIERFGLRELYHRVEHCDATNWWRTNVDEVFDLVIAGDCLQHLPKSEGLDFLNAMVYRCAWLIVLVPEFVVQGQVDGLPSAVHRSVWSERDLHWHDLWAWDNARSITLMVLRGYQSSQLTIEALVQQMNRGEAAPLLDYDGQTVVRPCRLRYVDHAREVPYRLR